MPSNLFLKLGKFGSMGQQKSFPPFSLEPFWIQIGFILEPRSHCFKWLTLDSSRATVSSNSSAAMRCSSAGHSMAIFSVEGVRGITGAFASPNPIQLTRPPIVKKTMIPFIACLLFISIPPIEILDCLLVTPCGE